MSSLPLFKMSANPESASNCFEDFQRNFEKKLNQKFRLTDKTQLLTKIFGNSLFLSYFLIKHPEIAPQIYESNFIEKEKTQKDFHKEINQIIQTTKDLSKDLRLYKYKELTRITIKELCLLDQEIIYRELSHLAISIVNCVTSNILNGLLERYKLKKNQIGSFSILAMGKLGGRELNYSSDIDLIGFYETDCDHDITTNHEFYTKLFHGMGKAITETTEEGFLYRMDWDLRPEGKSGVLANSLLAMERYYETFGAQWERQAYVRASTLFEQDTLGENFLKTMNPFTYRKSLDLSNLQSLSDIKSRIHTEHEKRAENGFNVKLSRGGIREIEFFIQTMQLIFGGRITDLQCTNSFLALRKLFKHKILHNEDFTLLDKSLRFMRRLESALQMENEQQTHLLGSSFEEQKRAARRLGITGSDDEAVETLMLRIHQTRATVKKIVEDLHGH